MRYLQDVQEPGMGTWYFEINEQGIAYRQIVIHDDGSIITSNRKHEQHHFMLAEHPLDPKEPYYEEINQDEFNRLWNQKLVSSAEQWNQTKSKFPVGASVKGYIEAFFPQGTLINLLAQDAVGLVDTALLESLTPEEWMYPGYRVMARVSGYDEINQWVCLKEATVTGEK
ncbi:hypothetical protein ACFSVM_08730 [Paenibacillus shunpengii]|uniref:S1 motif domain-containing protein n=1 Tax=Paenibacillus shunpengii TaxID=2054424 RepID=A0ABW5SLJ2_9BACL